MRTKTNAGFTLIEVMVALAITAFVTTAVFETFKTQHKNYLVQDDITNIQQNSRASIDELTRQIREAGYGVPGQFPSIYATNSNPDTLTVVYQYKDCRASLASSMSSTSQELTCSGPVDCFSEGQDALIYEADSMKGEFFVVSQVQTGAKQLFHTSSALTRKYGANSMVLSLVAAKFYIDNSSDASHPRLMVKYGSKPATVYADNMTDLQFRYRMKNGTILDVPTLASDVREVLISVTGRSDIADPDKSGSAAYRIRTFASSASMRNFGS